jgi:hypothetical protein
MSPQVGTRTTALIGTILDMQLMVTPQATMVEVTSVRATVAVIVAARTPEVEAETVVVAVAVAVAVATDSCPTEWAVDTRSLLPREAQATKSGGGRRWRLTTHRG